MVVAEVARDRDCGVVVLTRDFGNRNIVVVVVVDAFHYLCQLSFSFKFLWTPKCPHQAFICFLSLIYMNINNT